VEGKILLDYSKNSFPKILSGGLPDSEIVDTEDGSRRKG